jgi:sugar transferase (PEP-CTERM/EpsH1 system associated)
MKDLLFLSHRIPYPPDKGDKIRAWNILQHLAGSYRIHLGTFVDAREDVQHLGVLEGLCASVFWRPLSPGLAKLRSLRSLLSGAPLTAGYFGDERFRAGINDIIIRHKPNVVYAFSSAMTPYVTECDNARVIIDMVDVDSEKWRQYAAASSGLGKWVYSREGRLLLKLEREAARVADAVLFVSRAEAELFTSLAPETTTRTHFVTNGVDAEHFCPSLEFPTPFGDRPAIVFTGMMNYRPNVDAMEWFVEHVMPRLRTQPGAPELWIVGAKPTRAVRALARPDVHVTGRVPDVRPYLRHAMAVVAPLRIGRGIQNKVLEAMAMGAAVVATPEAREGLERSQDNELLTADSADRFAEALIRIFNGELPGIGARARARVVHDYLWETTLTPLDALVDADDTTPTVENLMAATFLQAAGR